MKMRFVNHRNIHSVRGEAVRFVSDGIFPYLVYFQEWNHPRDIVNSGKWARVALVEWEWRESWGNIWNKQQLQIHIQGITLHHCFGSCFYFDVP